MPQTESRNIFIPTDHERRVLLELLQSPQESLESIANEFKITLAALTIYLATDDAATLFAQADLANARRARTAAAAQLEQCVGALSLMISGWVSDVTHNLRRETPKSRREQDREQESTRRAAILLYRIANFTPRIITACAPPLPAKRGEVPESASGWGAVRGQDACIAPPTPENPPLPNTNPTRERGVTQTPLAPPTHANQHLSSPHASPNPTPPPAATIAPIPAPTSDIPNPKSDIPTSPRPATQRAANHAAASPRDPAALLPSHMVSLNPEPASSSSRAPPMASAPA